jgi:energy-coupling factor transporter ATP-binding protein EcfA2
VRIKSVRLAWFRGASDPVALEPDGQSLVVYGQNGAGKSSFVDAVEYVVNGGKLGHLTHEYSGRHQEKGIPNTHTPDDRSTEFSVVFQGGAELKVKIARNGAHTKSGADAINMGAWDYRRTVLRQDEVAEFIHSSKGGKYSALLPLLGLHELEVAAENLRQLARVVEQQSKLAHKQAVLGQSEQRRKQIFSDCDVAIEAQIVALHQKYSPASQTTEAVARCAELEAALNKRINEFSVENQRHLALRAIAGLDMAGAVKAVRGANAELAGSLDPLISEKLQVLQAADAFAEQLGSEGTIPCPACGQLVAVERFKKHVRAEHERLEEILTIFRQRRSAIGAVIDVLKMLKSTLSKNELSTWCEGVLLRVLERHVEWITQYDAEGLRQSLNEGDLRAIEDRCAPIIVAADRASQNAPPEIQDLSRDRVLVEAAKGVFEARPMAEEIAKIDGLVAFIQAVEAGIRHEIRERSEAVIKEISTDIGDMWKALHPGEPIEDVRLYLPEDDKAIDIALKFHGKNQDSPRLTLSEGYRNSLGLCLFLAMAKREAGSDRPVFLDDVVVSLDRNHRGMIVQLLEDEFAKRQVIVFTHDRDWYAELRQQLDDKRWKFKTLLPYDTPTLGIRWSERTTTFDDARAHLKDRPDSAGNDARKIMDTEMALVAERLQVRLPYLRGDRNDKRMWSDFLERLIADGRKCFQKKTGVEFSCNTDALMLLENAERLLASWGNKSSHSTDVTPSEVTKLINTCEKALDVFKCASCGKYL